MADLRSWKLIHDPFLKKGLQKLVRYDGIVPGNPAYNVHHLSDPRTLVPSRHSWGGREPLDIPIPPFKIDENYVGPPPPKEVSFTDLNDNISPAFLADLCKKCGEYDDLRICYHPVDKRHLGIGHVVFKKMKYAAICIEKYDGTSIMGKCVRVFLDPFGKQIKKLEQDLSNDESSAGTSVKENASMTSKRCQNSAGSSTALASQSSETPSVATPQCLTTVPEDPMSSQQPSNYVPQVYPNCLPPQSMPPYSWPAPQNFWPQGAQWPPPSWPVPFPQAFPPYPQTLQPPQEVGYNVWPSVVETNDQQHVDSVYMDEKNKQPRKNCENNKQNRERDRGRPMDARQQQKQRRNRTPESRPPSAAASSRSKDRHESDKTRCDDIRDSIDKRAQRFINKMSRKSPSPRRRSVERNVRNQSPTIRKRTPTDRKHSPADRKRSPSNGKRSPLYRKRSPSDRKRSPTDRKRSPSDRRHSPNDRKHSPSDDSKNKRRDDRSSLAHVVRGGSIEGHRRRSRTPPQPKKLGNKLYHWHNHMHTSPIVAKYETYRYGNRNAKGIKDQRNNVRRRGEKLSFDKGKKEPDSDHEVRRHKEDEPVVEYEEEYYRRKKLGPPTPFVDKPSGLNNDRRTIISDERDVSNPSTSTNFVDEIEEYKYVSRKLCQRVPVVENNGNVTGVNKLEAISSTEDDDEDIHYLNSKQYSSSKSARKNNRRSGSSVSSNNSSVRLQYSSLSEGESANEPHVKGRHKRKSGRRVSKDVTHLERVSSLEKDDISDISSSSSSAMRARRRHRSRKRRDEPKHIVREVFKEKRADLRTNFSRKQQHISSEDGTTGSGTPLVDEPLPNFKKTFVPVHEGKKLDGVRPSSSLEKRIQNILRGDGKLPSGGIGTPLQDEPLVDEKQQSTAKLVDKAARVDDDDDKMSLSSGQSRPTSRNEEIGDQSQKSAIPAAPTMPMSAYGAYPPNYNPYDPNNLYAAMMYANMMNPYGMPPGAQQFAQMPMWSQALPTYSSQQTPCEPVKPAGISIDFNDPQVIKRLTNKTCLDVVKDLKAVLHKDVSKRLIENSAFQILDSWFSKQDKVNEILKPKNDPEDKAASTSASHAASTTNVTTSLSRLFVNESTSGLAGSNSGSDLTRLFGFGLRATLPKLPSFKRKVPPPQPAQRRRHDDDERRSPRDRKSRSRRLRSASRSSSSSDSKSNSSSNESGDDEDDRKSRTSESSMEETDRKKIQLKDCAVVISSDSDEINNTPATKLLQMSADESEKSSVSDDSDDEDENKSGSERNSDQSSSSDDDSDAESSENEKEDQSVKKLNDITQKNSSFERSFSRRRSNSPTVLGVYAETIDEKENVINNKKTSGNEIRNIDEDSFECMTIDDTDRYRPTVHDHCYFYPTPVVENLPPSQLQEPILDMTKLKPSPPKRGRPTKKDKVSDLLKQKRAAFGLECSDNVALKLSKTTSSKTHVVPPPIVVPPPKPDILFKPRDALSETKVLYDFLSNGIDEEDINYMKRTYDAMLAESSMEPCLQSSHWTSHVPTASSPIKKRRIATDDFHVHNTGSARSEGFYRPSGKIKRTFTKATRQANDNAVLPPSLQVGDQAAKQQAQLSREARSNQRRLLTTLGDADFLKFNQLKYRKKLIRFSRSNIHGWGLFALEDIGQDEMIIEYVGEKVRLIVAEKREANYEKKGIGSSYLFRIDNEMVIDATKRGAVARFINHSCNPSCYAKIISLDGEKRIVIYSKQLIAKGEEITYDYKFPFEDVKIPCNCGAHNCRGSLN